MNQTNKSTAVMWQDQWLYGDGTVLPVVSGGDGEDAVGDGDGEKGSGSSRTFTQEEMNRIASKEKKDGRKTGRSEFLEELGFKEGQEDALKELIKAVNDKREQETSELDKAKKTAAEEAAKRQELEAELQRERLNRKIDLALLKHGVSPSSAEKVRRIVEVDPGAEDADIEEAILKLKEDVPALFVVSQDGENGSGKDTDTNSDLGKPPVIVSKAKAGFEERARDRLMAKHGDKIRSKSTGGNS